MEGESMIVTTWSCRGFVFVFAVLIVGAPQRLHANFVGVSNPMSLTDRFSPNVTITSYAPPALLVIQDAQGRRAGVDPSKPVTSCGDGTAFSAIPESIVDPLNTTDDTTGK